MTSKQSSDPAPGWIGGFEETNPAFSYLDSDTGKEKDPDLTSLDMLGNMDNIKKLDRQQKVLWPEFSWQTIPGNNDSRCFQMFAPDISRLGYTNEGRVYSIICPQQGACLDELGCMNVEVTVTGQRGWANETTKEIAADMTVTGTIWFSPSAHDKFLIKLLNSVFDHYNFPFPSTKEKAIKVTTHKPGDINEPIFPLRKGETKEFKIPEFARHPDEAWDVGHLGVQIGPLEQTGNPVVDEFNHLVMRAFNLASGNMLQSGNVLTWNVWFTAPELVNRLEWKTHAKRWRKSLNVDHGSPTGDGTDPKYFDGTPFSPGEAQKEKLIAEIKAFVKKHIKHIL